MASVPVSASCAIFSSATRLADVDGCARIAVGPATAGPSATRSTPSRNQGGTGLRQRYGAPRVFVLPQHKRLRIVGQGRRGPRRGGD